MTHWKERRATRSASSAAVQATKAKAAEATEKEDAPAEKPTLRKRLSRVLRGPRTVSGASS